MAESFPRPELHSAFRDHLRVLGAHPWRWLVPAMMVGLAASIYAYQLRPKFEVEQAVIVRNNAAAEGIEPGEFRSSDPMKRTQATIAEICLSNNVLRAALLQLKSANSANSDASPSPLDVAQLREMISIQAPNGAEFGTTEVFNIKVSDESQERALQLVVTVFQCLKDRVGEILDLRAQGMLIEVEKTVALARQELQDATRQLRAIEESAGGDLVELRMLHHAPNGQGDLIRLLTQQEQDLVRLESEANVNEGMLQLLGSAKDDQDVLQAAPPDLLAAHPPLGSLRQALLDTELRTASLRKNLTDSYPTVQAAVHEEQLIRTRLREELNTAIRVVTADGNLRRSRILIVKQKRDELRARLAKLATIRADYSNLVNMAAHRQTELETAERRLANVRGQQAVARSTSIISQLDEPAGSAHPVGPSRAVIVLAGLAGGLMCGVGLVFLTVVEPPIPARAGTTTVRPPSTATAAPGWNRRGSEPSEHELSVAPAAR